jgi:Ca2+-binding RTX toxin-like protein
VSITINGHTDATDVLAPTDIVFNVNPASGSFSGNGLANTDVIGTFTAIDADSTSWTFALSGTNASSFTLTPSTGLQSSVTLTPSAALAPGNYTFVVTATDGAGHSYAETYNVSVGTTGADGAVAFTVSNGTDVSFGLNGGDTINGGAGDDALVGGQNGDTINGGLGNDQLIGGQGGDTFIFNTTLNATTNVDTIFDFDAANTPSSDHIQLDDAIFAGIANSGGSLSTTDFVANAGGNATTASQNILFDTTTGNLYYDADGNGAGAKVLVAHITVIGGTVDASDFVVI